MLRKALLLLALVLVCSGSAWAQVGGIKAQQTASNPLQLRITDGDVTSTLGTYTFKATNVLLTASATNYVYLDLSTTPPTLAVNTTGFPASNYYAIATVVTNAKQITAMTDSRPSFNSAAFSGGGGGGGGGGSQHQVNGLAVLLNNPINLRDNATVTWTNPSAGNIEANIASGGVSNAMLASGIDPAKILGTAEVQSHLGAANGYAPLDAASKLPLANLPTHVHPESDITNLVSDLAGKAAASHTHAASDIASGVLAYARGGLGATGTAADQIFITTSPSAGGFSSIGDCSNATTSKVLYATATHSFTCGTDQTGAGGAVNGTGTTNRVVTFTASSTIGDSSWEFNGSHLRPITDASFDIGDATHQVRDLYLSGSVKMSGPGPVSFEGATGTCTAAGASNGKLCWSSTGNRPVWSYNTGSNTNVLLATDNLSALASSTSAQLAGVLSDETGSGAAVFATSPTLSSPTLTTPTIASFANATHDHSNAAGGGQLTGTAFANQNANTFFAGPASGSAATATFRALVPLDMVSGVNSQSGTTYTIAASDNGKLVTINNAASVAVTQPQAGTAGFANGFFYYIFNRGAGAATITPTTSTINGNATLVLNQGQGARIVSDGTNYSAWVSAAPSGSGTVTSVALSAPSWLSVSGSPVTGSGTLAVSAATGQTSHQVIGTCGSATSFAPCALVAADLPATTPAAASAAAAANQLWVSGGADRSMTAIDFPDSKSIPFCVNVNGTAATGVTTTTAVACTARAGTNNKDAFLGPFTTSDTATFKVHLPKDWDTATAPSLSVDLASTDATSGHTVILQAATECAKGDGSTTDDVAFTAAQSLSTVTLNGTANATWTATLSSLTTTGCSAPGIMWVKITRTTDTATNVELYQANITIPRLVKVQAN